jgi:hypothetical protein
MRFTFAGDSANATAILGAHREFFKNIKRDKQKREAIRKANPGYSHTGVVKGSIVFNYYILGRTTFRQ